MKKPNGTDFKCARYNCWMTFQACRRRQELALQQNKLAPATSMTYAAPSLFFCTNCLQAREMGLQHAMELIEITEAGTTAREIDELPKIAADVVKSTADMYRVTGFQPPWVGYIARNGGDCIGTCAFKKPPMNGRVEIAYFTFPGNEGHGFATSMAKWLIELAIHEVPDIRIFAQILPEHNASTRVLEKLGFRKTVEIEHPEDGRAWEWGSDEPAPLQPY